MVWTLVEPGVAIVASSLVTIRPLLRKMRLKGFESTERSRGLHYTPQSASFGATGGSRGGATTRSGTQRGGMPGYGPGSSIKLADLESGGGGGGGKGGGYWSQSTTLTSRTSTHGARTGWGVGVAVTVREDDEDADRISPVVAGSGHGTGRSGVSTPESDIFVIEGPARTQYPAQSAVGPWRSETPTSAEESEHSQGLRYPGHHGGESTATAASHLRDPKPWPLSD